MCGNVSTVTVSKMESLVNGENLSGPTWEKYSKILPNEGVCVDDIKGPVVSEAVVCQYFGKKSSKSGWKYEKHSTSEEAAAILSLWQRVYNEERMPNKEITLQFARGLILQSQEKKVNWAQFAVSRQKYREELMKTKASRKGLERVGEEMTSGTVSVIGKKRVRSEGLTPISTLPELKLTIKSIVDATSLEMDKKQCLGKGKGKGRVDTVLPSWCDSDLQDMATVIEHDSELMKACKEELKEHLREKENLEGNMRRAKILLSDRLVMLRESKGDVEKLEIEESDLKSQIVERKKSMNSADACILEMLEAKIDDVILKKNFEVKTVSMSTEVVADCEATILRGETLLQESANRYNLISNRVLLLECNLARMADQLQRMSEGGGHAFFPRPISGNPKVPLSTVHIMNACPVCGFWYSCYNFISLGCGHTYHPWCLAEHSARGSTTCCMKLCEEPFHIESSAAIGIRPAPALEEKVVQKRDGPLINGSGIQITNIRLSIPISTECTSGIRCCPQTMRGSSSDDSIPEKRIQLSQCSESPMLTSSKGSAADITKQSLDPICQICKKKPAAVVLKACGHDVFCFGCIQGLKSCPLCRVAVVGWGRIRGHDGNISPGLGSIGNMEGAMTDQVDIEATPKSSGVEVLRKEAVEPPGAIDKGFDGNEEEEQGLIHWCSADIFNDGGARSSYLVDSNEIQINVAQEDTPKKRLAQLEDDNIRNKRLSTEGGLFHIVGSGEDVLKPSAVTMKPVVVAGKKKGRPQTNIQTLNHTRVVEKRLDDILQVAPLVPVPKQKNATSSTKRGPGHRASVSKSQAPSTQQQGRTTGRHNGWQSIPAKFRNME